MHRQWLLILFILAVLTACQPEPAYPELERLQALPEDARKITPAEDAHPPVMHLPEYQDPVPIPGAVNSAGGEDSPFILPDGETLYFFFTPDVRLPAEAQVQDPTSGIWVSHKSGGEWALPERVWLQSPGKLALDGAPCVQGDELWFASVREGFTGVNLFTAARNAAGNWTDWTYAGDRLMKEIQAGEVHLHGETLYFHADRAGGLGGYDLWTTTREGGTWSDPVHLQNVNSPEMDGFPFVSSDGQTLWFTRPYEGTPAVFHSQWQGESWSAPTLVISQFAGEPTLDSAGNIYFVHHFYQNGTMLEADLYVAYKK
jgi:hypothetical protein